MDRLRVARVLLSTVLIVGSALSFALDWSSNHLLSPAWHPHAKFHAAVLLFFFAGVSLTGTWLLWRRSSEPLVGIKAASALSAAYWLPFFFVPYALPGASYWAGLAGHEPHIHGMLIYPNLVVIAMFLMLTVLGCWLGVSHLRPASADRVN